MSAALVVCKWTLIHDDDDDDDDDVGWSRIRDSLTIADVNSLDFSTGIN